MESSLGSFGSKGEHQRGESVRFREGGNCGNLRELVIGACIDVEHTFDLET